MLVRCITNIVDKLPASAVKARLRQSIHREGPDEDLIVGQTYPVLAIARWQDGGIRVYLHTVADNDHPYPYPVEMFEVVDASLPPEWTLGFGQYPDGTTIERIGFPEWVKDDRFYEKLVDGDDATIAVYRHQRNIASAALQDWQKANPKASGVDRAVAENVLRMV
ncbi:MAG: hypothetical protein GX565_18450 [Lentisphaerae bacterium]|nr:hypothetical protein [Lentisphaerota bacterium]